MAILVGACQGEMRGVGLKSRGRSVHLVDYHVKAKHSTAGALSLKYEVQLVCVHTPHVIMYVYSILYTALISSACSCRR